MTDVKELRDLIERLRELGEFPHDVAGAQSDIQQAASALQSLVDRCAAMDGALRDCAEFLAARFAPDRDGWNDDEAMRLEHRARSALPPEAQS